MHINFFFFIYIYTLIYLIILIYLFWLFILCCFYTFSVNISTDPLARPTRGPTRSPRPQFENPCIKQLRDTVLLLLWQLPPALNILIFKPSSATYQIQRLWRWATSNCMISWPLWNHSDQQIWSLARWTSYCSPWSLRHHPSWHLRVAASRPTGLWDQSARRHSHAQIWWEI